MCPYGRKCSLRAKIGHLKDKKWPFFITFSISSQNFEQFVLKNAIKSSFSQEKVENFLYSSLSFYLGHHGRKLRQIWIVYTCATNAVCNPPHSNAWHLALWKLISKLEHCSAWNKAASKTLSVFLYSPEQLAGGVLG